MELSGPLLIKAGIVLSELDSKLGQQIKPYNNPGEWPKTFEDDDCT